VLHVRFHKPFALARFIVPRHKDVAWLDLNSLTREFLADFCEEFLLF
jgi:hypothetical protein